MKEQLVHVPEPVLECGCLGGGRRRERVRVDLGEREVPEGEANAPVELSLDPFDRAKRLPRVGAFVVAVLDDETSGRRAADVIDLLVERLQCVGWTSSLGIARLRRFRTRPAAG